MQSDHKILFTLINPVWPYYSPRALSPPSQPFSCLRRLCANALAALPEKIACARVVRKNALMSFKTMCSFGACVIIAARRNFMVFVLFRVFNGAADYEKELGLWLMEALDELRSQLAQLLQRAVTDQQHF